MEVHVDEDNGYVLELSPAQGLINLRWPCTRFKILTRDKLFGSITIGTCTMCSFVRDGVLHQIARLCPFKYLGSDASDNMDSEGSSETGASYDSASGARTISFTIGGYFRFGCCSSSRRSTSGDRGIPFCDKYSILLNQESPFVMACYGDTHDERLEMRLWENEIPVKLAPKDARGIENRHTKGKADAQFPHDAVHLYALHEVHLPGPTEPSVTLVATFSLLRKTSPMNWAGPGVISPPTVQDYLGVSDDYIGSSEAPIAAPYRFLSTVFGQFPSPGPIELNVIGRGLEQILGVASVSFRLMGEHGSSRERVALVRSIVTPQMVDLSSTL